MFFCERTGDCQNHIFLFITILFLVFVNVLGLAQAKTSLYVNGTTADEIRSIKDALTDKQSGAYKDIESDFISKLDSTMSTFYPTTSFELSYIDFVQGMCFNCQSIFFIDLC